MTDIVTRLRLSYMTEEDLHEAADEIERLRAQVVSLQSSLDAGPPRPGKKTPDALER